MNTLIIEDEKPAARRLSKLLAEVDPELQILGILETVESTVEWLNTHPAPDLLFMDIQLADGSSFEILRQTRVQSPVIFTTAYDEFALNAFKVNSVDYLMKPIRKQDLETALQKLKNLKMHYNLSALEALAEAGEQKYKERFVIKLGNRIKSIAIHEIAYFFSKDKLSFICDLEGKHFPIDLSLDKIETLLNPQQYFRVNRQIIASFTAIKDIQTSTKSRIILTLTPPTTLEAVISSERSGLFKKWLKR